jgi:hypothetical protein
LIICFSARIASLIKKHLKDNNGGLKIMLTEKEELEDLVEQYEANLSNATSIRVRILEIVNNGNDDKYKEKIFQRISEATDEFQSFIDEEQSSK